jgi:hypothetical protein
MNHENTDKQIVDEVVRPNRKGGEPMWRLYVGGLLTGFGIGVFVAWCVAWLIVPASAFAQIPLAPPIMLTVFVLAGERLRIRGSKPPAKERAGAG